MTGPSDGADFSVLRAMFIKCTLKRSPELSHTEGLVDASAAIMLKHGGPSYLDPGSGGPENAFTNRNTTFMTWNLMQVAQMLKAAGSLPAHGNQRSAWDAGARFDFEPECR